MSSRRCIMRYRKVLVGAVLGVVAVLLSVFLFLSCGGGGGIPVAASGKVALYVTDDISDYKQVIATINNIQLVNTGSGASCDVFTGPLTVDITNLANVLQLISVAVCPSVPYNRIHVEFAQSVSLMDLAGSTSPCTFISYLNEHNVPNKLQCDSNTGICSLNISGAVNVLAMQYNKLAMDFNLKDFDVNDFGASTCSVTMKVSPLHAGDMKRLGHPESISGTISGLDITAMTFRLKRGNLSFTVDYSGITDALQPGLDVLLQRAQDDQLRVKVRTTSIDFTNGKIVASAISAKVEGTIATASLNTTDQTFTVNYGSSSTIMVDYQGAVVEGALAEGAWVDVKLYGFNGSNFLANKVEVEDNGTAAED
jgi:hypothetical protein